MRKVKWWQRSQTFFLSAVQTEVNGEDEGYNKFDDINDKYEDKVLTTKGGLMYDNGVNKSVSNAINKKKFDGDDKDDNKVGDTTLMKKS